MAGYSRQDTNNNIANGNVIDADDLDAEFNALEDAFNASTGHNHDGTAGGGATLTTLGPSADLVVNATAVRPKTAAGLDIGTSTVQFKDGFFDGTLNTDILSVDETSTFTGVITANAGVTGDLTGDVKNSDGTVVVDVGSDSVDAAFDGNLTGNVTGNLTGSIINSDGTTIFTNGSDTVDATFDGNVTGNLTGNVTGNADTADAWSTARTVTIGGTDGNGDQIGDVNGSFTIDGSGDLSGVSLTVVGTSLPSGSEIALGTETTGNYVTSITNGNYLTGGDGGSESAALTLAVDATTTATASKVVARDASGDFAANEITSDLVGNVKGSLKNATGDAVVTSAATASDSTFVGTASKATNLATQRAFSLTGDVTATAVQFNGSGDVQLDTTVDSSLTYADSKVDTHLNKSSATSGQLLSWNGTDYAWVTSAASYSDTDVDAHLNRSSASSNQVLSWDGSDYAWTTPATASNNYVSGVSWDSASGVITLSRQGLNNLTVDIDGRYLTAHPDTSSASSSNNSSNTFIQDLTIDGNGHVTAIGTGTASFSGVSQVFGSVTTFTGTRITSLGSSTKDKLYYGAYSWRYGRQGAFTGSGGFYANSYLAPGYYVGTGTSTFTLTANLSDAQWQHFFIYLPAGVTMTCTQGSSQAPLMSGLDITIGEA